jgi:hypothetical protein
MTEKPPTVIEQTSKKWKGFRALGCLSLVLGFLAIGAWDAPVAGLLLVTFGLVAYIGGRVGAWWHHG